MFKIIPLSFLHHVAFLVVGDKRNKTTYAFWRHMKNTSRVATKLIDGVAVVEKSEIDRLAKKFPWNKSTARIEIVEE